MAITVKGVGHVVLKVREIEPALRFYRDVLGLAEVARADFGSGPMVFLSTGEHHHDIALLEVGPDARRPEPGDVGLFHVALKIGEDLETLRAARDHLTARGVRIGWIAEHRVSQSIYVADPDGNTIELYVDADLAADGIDELLDEFLVWVAEGAAPLAGSVHLHCTDVAGEWVVRGDVVTREHAKGDAAIRGPAHDLLMVLWRRQRLDSVDVVGDAAVAERFVARTNLT